MEHLDLFKNKAGDAEELFGENAKKYIKSGATVLLDVIKSTLGPKGALKILQGQNDHVCTNDGATIMSNVQLDVPSAKVLIDLSKSQDVEEGDGTTSVAVLAALIIKNAHESKVHPIHIIRGLSLAIQKIDEILNNKKFVAIKDDIKQVVKTTLNSKILNSHMDLFADICIKAVENLEGDLDLNLINIVNINGDLSESRWVEGVVMDKTLNIHSQEEFLNNIEHKLSINNTPDEVVLYKKANPKILVANTSLDYDKIKILTSKIDVTSISELEKVEKAEKDRMVEKIEGICKIDFDIFVNRQIIYDYNMHLLLSKNKIVVENAGFDHVERLNKVLGGKVLSHFFEEHPPSVVGTCQSVEQIKIKEKTLVKFSGCKNKGASSILLFGSSNALLEEAERAIHDALCVIKRMVKEKNLLLGGGNTEVTLACELLKYSQEIKSVESEGALVLSQALFEFVEILCENCGFDPNEFKSAIVALYNSRTMYSRNSFSQGLDITTGKPVCMKGAKVFEGYSMKLRVLKAACETAQSLLKCDGVITHPPRERHTH